MADQFLYQVPDRFRGDSNATEYFRALNLFLDTISGPDGDLETGAATTVTVLTHSEKLDLITITASIDLDANNAATAANTAAEANMQAALDGFTINNSTTNRTIDADAAAGAISVNPSQAEVENIRDAVLALADNVTTLMQDMKT